MPGDGADGVSSAEQQPGLGTAEQLVATGGHHVGPGGQRRCGVGLVGQQRVGGEQPAAQVGHQRDPVLIGQGAQLGEGDRPGETFDAKVAGMHLEQAAGVRSDGARVVLQPSAVGGADLAQPSPGRRNEVGQPEAGADLDQLTPADDHLATGGERGGGQYQRGRAVVDHQRVLGVRAGGEQCGASGVPPSGPLAGGQVELHVDVAGRGDQRVDGCSRQRCPTQVGVHHHPGRVQHRAQRRRAPVGQLCPQDPLDVCGRQVAAPGPFLQVTDDGPNDPVAQPLAGGLHGRQRE